MKPKATAEGRGKNPAPSLQEQIKQLMLQLNAHKSAINQYDLQNKQLEAEIEKYKNYYDAPVSEVAVKARESLGQLLHLLCDKTEQLEADLEGLWKVVRLMIEGYDEAMIYDKESCNVPLDALIKDCRIVMIKQGAIQTESTESEEVK
ncbi:hypothetical protein KA005_27310 [bacterium]|nr:hypothetical protein [bacterium]